MRPFTVWLMFVNAKQDIVAVRRAVQTEAYLIEPCIAGTEATCGVLEQLDGALIALPPIEIVPADGAFDYRAKYLAQATQEICPGRFAPEVSAAIMAEAIKAHRALSCGGYSRSDFIISKEGPIFLETNTLPGLTGFQSASNGGTNTNGTITWNLGTVAAGTSVSRTVTVQIAGRIPAGAHTPYHTATS